MFIFKFKYTFYKMINVYAPTSKTKKAGKNKQRIQYLCACY